jgi:hypothetical protein
MSNYNPSTGKYETKDSGKRFQSPDGMVRDTSEGKPQFALLFPKGVPYEDQLMTRVADLYHRGGVKYGPRNWEKSSTEEALAKHEDCLMRHVVKFLLGVEDGEDHAAAVIWNVNAVDLTRRKIAMAEAEKSWPDYVNLSTKGVKEVLPEYATESEQAKAAAEFLAKTNKAVSVPDKDFPTVEFAEGDAVLDQDVHRWVYGGGRWHCKDLFLACNWTDLVRGYAPLVIQTGAYAGITVLKDGGISHDGNE